MPQFDSGTPKPKNNFVSIFVPSLQPALMTGLHRIPCPSSRTIHVPPPTGLADSTFNNLSWHWLQCKAVGLLVWAGLLRHIWGRRSRGQTRGIFMLLQYIYIT
jgi:hypothetical protein